MHIQILLESLPYTYTNTDKYTLPSFCTANHVFCYKIDLAYTSKIYLFTREIPLSGMIFLFALSFSEIGLIHGFIQSEIS